MRLRLIAVAFAACTFLTPAPAHAGFITAFLSGAAAVAGIGTGAAALSGPWAAAALAGAQLAGFFSGGIPALVLSTALQFGANYLLQQINKPKAEELTASFKSPTPVRRVLTGQLLVSGNMVFSATKAGSVTYALHHGDSECVATLNHWFLDRPLTIGTSPNRTGSDWVTNAPFIRKGTSWFEIDAKNGTLDQTVSTLIQGDYPEWDEYHRGVGCCFTAVKGWPIHRDDRGDIYKFQGPLGLGEPAYLREGEFWRKYDPRLDSTCVIGEEDGAPVYGDGPQRVDTPSTWAYTRNAALTIATFRIHPDGWGKPADSVNWAMIAAAADISDEEITGRDDIVVRRWSISTAIPFNEERMAAEKRMLEACDGMRFFDADGKWFIRVGAWEEPEVALGKRDITRICEVPDDDGESAKNAFVADYSEPLLNYTTQPSAPWYHPDYYEEGVTPVRLAKFEVPESDSHNQTVRVCAAVGRRSRAKKLEITAGWLALRLREKRFVAIGVGDAVIDGGYEILGYREAPDGMSVALVLSKSGPGFWTLGEGEEGPLPTYDNPLAPDDDMPEPTNFTPFSAAVPVSGGWAARLEATFDAPDNPSYEVTVEYKRAADSIWLEMVSVTDQGRAYADQLADDGEDYRLRAYTVSSGGSISDYVPDATGALVTAVADPVAPDPVEDAAATPGTGEADFSWTNPNSANAAGARVYTHTADDFGAATLAATVWGAPGAAGTVTVALSAGAHYGWIVAINGSGVEATPAPTGSFTVT